MAGALERLVITLSGDLNSDVVATQVSAIEVSILPQAGLKDVSGASHAVALSSFRALGSWGNFSGALWQSLRACVYWLLLYAEYCVCSGGPPCSCFTPLVWSSLLEQPRSSASIVQVWSL
jgi:hypothetical protein